MRYAQAYFNREHNAWTVGYYDSSRAGPAESWTTRPTESEARRAADEYNAMQHDHNTMKQKKPRRVREPETYVDLMFKNTISGGMLRTLCERGQMTQADFMTLYHVRCDRPTGRACFRCSGTGTGGRLVNTGGSCARCDGTGVLPGSRSSFGDNFGRFIRSQRRLRDDSWATVEGPIRCIQHDRTPTGRKSATRQNTLAWDRPNRESIIRDMTIPQLERAECAMERVLTTGKHPSTSSPDDIRAHENEHKRWLDALRDEIRRRSGIARSA